VWLRWSSWLAAARVRREPRPWKRRARARATGSGRCAQRDFAAQRGGEKPRFLHRQCLQLPRRPTSDRAPWPGPAGRHGWGQKGTDQGNIVGLTLEGSATLWRDLSAHTGLGLGVVYVTDKSSLDKTMRGGYGSNYLAGVSYDYFPGASASPGLGRHPDRRFSRHARRQHSCLHLLHGVQVLWWSGLPARCCSCPRSRVVGHGVRPFARRSRHPWVKSIRGVGGRALTKEKRALTVTRCYLDVQPVSPKWCA